MYFPEDNNAMLFGQRCGDLVLYASFRCWNRMDLLDSEGVHMCCMVFQQLEVADIYRVLA
ncbi:hypothetical protein N7508_009205 [Penicillium antarcticum]|uniref:uncharacterized protein n=1 Tax=Penicillium antarcticum TaxID=416450 RepID=UPI002390ED1F|nr:uncharacterized protein N7508_009205 [Penicillium antarcticum]KAJ5294384.1 hypothetical protein N7508_009205 [Penicillium antarcticum]